MSRETALVSGATGFIGRRVLRKGDHALVRRSCGLAGERIADLTDPAALAIACAGESVVFHCAGYAHAHSPADVEAHWRINFEGSRNLAVAAGRAGVKRFVFLSSVKAMADPEDGCVDEDWPGAPASPYGRAKRAAEDAVLEAGSKYGMHAVNLRLAMVYGRGGRGNLERMVRGIRAGWFPPLPETGNKRSLVHVDDVVSAMWRVSETPEAAGRTYIVADPYAYSGREIYDAIRCTLQFPPPGWRLSADLLRKGGRLGDCLGKLMRREISLNSRAVERLLGSACYSPARIERELAWRAQIGLREGLREMLSNETLV